MIQGQYGTLTISGDGEYTYKADGSTFTGTESFSYTLTSMSGDTSTATLTVGVGREFTSTAFNDVITTSSNGPDTVIYDLLSATANGGNGTDVWTDFSAADGDTIDLTALLAGQAVTDQNLGNFVSVTQSGNNTVVSIDRDGSASNTTYAKVDLIVLENTTASSLALDELIKYNSPL